MLQWAGQILREIPHFRENAYGMGQGFMTSYGGYYVWKYYNTTTPVNSAGSLNFVYIYFIYNFTEPDCSFAVLAMN